MRLLANVFNIRPDAPVHDQVVIIELAHAADPAWLSRLHAALSVQVQRDALGEVDRPEIVGGRTVLLLYGADAERLSAGIEPLLRAEPLLRDAHITVRRGGPGAAQRDFRLQA